MIYQSIHIDSDTVMEVRSGESSDWLHMGEDRSSSNLHFDDDADVSRLIRELEVLRHRMRERAHLPEIESFDPVAESLDREQVEVGGR